MHWAVVVVKLPESCRERHSSALAPSGGKYSTPQNILTTAHEKKEYWRGGVEMRKMCPCKIPIQKRKL